MKTTIARRSLVTGVAWAAPTILASAAVPAYAASENCWPSNHGGTAHLPVGHKQGDLYWAVTEKVFDDAQVRRDEQGEYILISFRMYGGAGGSYSGEANLNRVAGTEYPRLGANTGIGGAGAYLEGTFKGRKGDAFKLISGAGGFCQDDPSTPAEPGEGYGNGGAHTASQLGSAPAGVRAREFFAPTGGGASAIVYYRNGEFQKPVAIAAGGGGAGTRLVDAAAGSSTGAQANTAEWKLSAPGSSEPVAEVSSGGTGGQRAGAGTSVTETYAHDESAVIPVNGGQGAGAHGAGGAGGAAAEPTAPTGSMSTASDSTVTITNAVQAGNTGENADLQGRANGGTGAVASTTIRYTGSPAGAEFHQIVHSGTGGGGYGGGGSGALTAVSGRRIDTTYEGNPNEPYATSSGVIAGGGGAGGSYLDTDFMVNSFVSTSEHPGQAGKRVNGMVQITYC